MTEYTNPRIQAMFQAGAHFATSSSRRHPTSTPYIFGSRSTFDIFDLEKTVSLLEKAKAVISTLAKEGKTILFVGGKSEARQAVRNTAMSLSQPYVDGRWIGGTLTNFPQIKKRIEKYERLTLEKEKGELAKYTKRERMLIDKEIVALEAMFGGIVSMKEMPKALFVIDSKREKIAVQEAKDMGIPVIALLGADCDIREVNHPILGNDASKSSIEYFLQEIVGAYQAGKKDAVSA